MTYTVLDFVLETSRVTILKAHTELRSLWQGTRPGQIPKSAQHAHLEPRNVSRRVSLTLKGVIRMYLSSREESAVNLSVSYSPMFFKRSYINPTHISLLLCGKYNPLSNKKKKKIESEITC